MSTFGLSSAKPATTASSPRGPRRKGLKWVWLLRGLVRKFGFDIVYWNKGRATTIVSGTVVRSDEGVSFFVANEGDHIQAHHLQGRFYEQRELELIAQHFKGGTFVDVGANVGNHVLYAVLLLGATQVIAIEPNPVAATILKINLSLNDVTDRVVHRNCGLSDRTGSAAIHTPINNLGGSVLRTSQEGEIAVEVGDKVLDGETVGFIKIDTEGMELHVLRGLKQTIVQQHPSLFVEVADENVDEFMGFLADHGYEVVARHRRYQANENFLAVAAR